MANSVSSLYDSLLCPICRQPLHLTGKSLLCADHHCFDLAKAGYVHLLPGSGGGRHGDDKQMVISRTTFLDKGYYAPLANLICKMVSDSISSFGSSPVVVDAGCGEGYYTKMMKDTLSQNGFAPAVFGFDISKDALHACAKRDQDFILAVASTSYMPFPDNQAHILLNIFSPFFGTEFVRVLAKDGLLVRVIPREQHLWELKELIYDTPYLNEMPDIRQEGLDIIKTEDLTYPFTLNNHEDIMSLFQMTPYFYKTSLKDQQKATETNSLTTTCAFRVILYKKK